MERKVPVFSSWTATISRNRLVQSGSVLAVLLVFGAIYFFRSFGATGATPVMTGVEACLQESSTKAAESSWTVTVRGEQRHFRVLQPSNTIKGKALPAILFFHGSGGRWEDVRWFNLYRGELRNEAVFVSPTGHNVTGGFGWDQSCTGPDMEFVDVILDMLPRIACVDTTRIVASGFSWGGDFVNDVGCCRGNRLSAIASFAGGDMGPNGGYAAVLADCSARTPPYIQVYGADDKAYPDGAFAGVTGNFAKLSQCSERISDVQGCRSYEGCRNPVIACRVPGMGHTVDERAAALAARFLRSSLGLPSARRN